MKSKIILKCLLGPSEGFLISYVHFPGKVGVFDHHRIFKVFLVRHRVGVQLVRIHEFVDPLHRDLALDQEHNLEKESSKRIKTYQMQFTSIGKMLRGTLSKLNRVKETKAVLASRMLLSSLKTNVAKEAKATKNGAEVHKKEVIAFK